MTYSEIFKEIYENNKKFIRAYITVCIIFSVLAFGKGSFSFASGNTSEIITNLGGTGGLLALQIPIVQTFISSTDPSTAFVVMSGVSFLLDVVPQSSLSSVSISGMDLSTLSFGLFDFNLVRVLCLVGFVIDKLSKSTHATCTSGVILEDYSNKIYNVMNAVSTMIQCLSIFSSSAAVAQAASGAIAAQTASDAAKFGLNALSCFLLLISVFLIYFLLRSLFYFINIILLPVCSLLPFASLINEVFKVLGVLVSFYLAIAHPYIFYAEFLLLLLTAIILFRTTYTTIRYFKNIYVRPAFKRIFGYKKDIPLIAPRIPGKILRTVDLTGAEIILPVYLFKRIYDNAYTHKYDRWWFVASRDRQFLCKPCFWSNSCRIIELRHSAERKMFIKKSIRFFEIFNLAESEANIGKTFYKIRKDVHFVFSKEFLHRFENIKGITGYADYTEYSNIIRQNQKQSKKEARKEARLQKKLAKRKVK